MQWASSTTNIHFGRAQRCEERGVLEPLGCGEYEIDLAAADLLENARDIGRRNCRVDRPRLHVQLGQLVRLVLHQCDERRHHDCRPRQVQGRQLVAQRLAGAGRHDCDSVAPLDDRLDDFALPGSELGQPERAVHEAFEGGWASHDHR
jgi:hypothetical protein